MNEFKALAPCTMLSPVPVVMVSCAGGDEKSNIITVAWTGTVNSDPPMVSVSLKKCRHSHHIIQQSGEFVLNLVDTAHCADADWCGVRSGSQFDKFAQRGLTPIPVGELQSAPAIGECPAHLACKVKQVIELGSHDLFLAEIVGVHIREDLFDPDGTLHLERADLVCYNHGLYQRTAEVLGFFGYSVARPEVLSRRMAPYRKSSSRKRAKSSTSE